MKAEIQRRTSTEAYLELGKVLPLETPFVLLIDPSNLCNYKCSFCPTGSRDLIRKTGRYQGNLHFPLFRKIIDDLKDFTQPVKVLRLYKEGEPLMNPFFEDMIRYAKDSNRISRIDTTTNGALLNPQRNRRIIAAGIDQINISVNGVGDEQNYTNTKIDFERYCNNIRDLYEIRGSCEIYIKAIKDNLSSTEQDLFFKIFGDMADRIYLESLSPAWPLFEFHRIETGFKSGHYGQPVVQRNVCPYIFYIMVVNSDGTTSLCVGDWQHKLSYGDTRKQSVKDIWLGDTVKTFRIAHLENRRTDNPICKACQVISHGTLENIDASAKDILQRMSQ